MGKMDKTYCVWPRRTDLTHQSLISDNKTVSLSKDAGHYYLDLRTVPYGGIAKLIMIIKNGYPID